MSTELEKIKNVLVSPDFIRKSEYDQDVRFYYKYYKNRNSEAKYLLVSIKYLNGKGFIMALGQINFPL